MPREGRLAGPKPSKEAGLEAALKEDVARRTKRKGSSRWENDQATECGGAHSSAIVKDPRTGLGDSWKIHINRKVGK